MFTSQEITVGFARSNNWFTPVQVDQFIPILSETIIKNRLIQDDLSLSESYIGCNELTNIICNGNLEYFLHFWNGDDNNILSYMLFLCMGSNNLQMINTSTWKRTIELTNNVYGKFCTLALNKIIAVHEMPSVKLSGFKIYGDINNILRIAFNTICNDRNINSVINTISVLRALEFSEQTAQDRIIPITLKYGEFLLDEYGEALNSEWGISEIDFMFDRHITGDYVANPDNVNQILEPMQDEAKDISLSITLPYYDTLKFIENFDMQTFKHATLTFIGPDISGGLGQRFTFKIIFNKLKIINEEDIITNLGLIPQTIKFKVLDDETNKPFKIEITNNDGNTIN
jgi:hypothetical protein